MSTARPLTPQVRAVAAQVAQLRRQGRAHEARRRLAEARDREGGFVARALAPLADENAAWCDDGVGAAWFPVRRPGDLGSHPGGLVRVLVHGRAGAIPTAGIRHAIEVGARAVGRPDAVGLGCTFWPGVGGPSGLTLEGESFQLAVALATWSHLTGRPLPARTAWTGVLVDPTGVLRAPASDSMQAKRSAVADAWGASGRMIVGGPPPRGDVTSLGAALSAYLDVMAPLPVQPVRERAYALRLFAARRDPQTLEHAEVVLAAGVSAVEPGDLFAAATIAAQQANHRGWSERALELGEEARAWASRALPGDRATLAASLAVSYIDLGRPVEACAVVEQTLAGLPVGAWEGACGDVDRVQLLGSLARALSARGRHDEAIAAAQRAIDCAPVSERARSLGDLALWSLRARHFEAAEVAVRGARASLPDAEAVAGEQARHTKHYLDLFEARIERALGRADRARALATRLEHRDDPALWLGALELRAHLGLPNDADAAAFDARFAARLAKPGVLSRYRARAELARPTPDRVQVRFWSGGWSPEELAVGVPY